MYNYFIDDIFVIFFISAPAEFIVVSYSMIVYHNMQYEGTWE